MRKSRTLFLVAACTLLAGIAWYGYSTTRPVMVVPVLQDDGTIGAAPGIQPTLFASILRESTLPGVFILLFSLGENVEIRNEPRRDFISFECPPGTDAPAHAVLGSAPRFYSTQPYWAWGPYIGNEGTRLAAGELPSAVFPQTKFLGNSAARQSGRFPFIDPSKRFIAGRFAASGGPPAGEVAVVACSDTDNDGLSDRYERDVSTTLSTDADTDDDGLGDGVELTGGNFNLGANGVPQSFVTNPKNADTDGDGVQDGTELGRVIGVSGTNGAVFIPDADPLTQTNPTLADTDAGGVSDGVEDANKNGRVDAPCETNPTLATDDPVVCGNGRLETCGADRVSQNGAGDDEQCDDGNTTNGDGCTSTCKLQVCGNGVVEAGEQCDDGKTCTGDGQWCEPPATGQQECAARNAGICQANSDDGCRNDCTIDPLYACSGTSIGQRTSCRFGAPQPQ